MHRRGRQRTPDAGRQHCGDRHRPVRLAREPDRLLEAVEFATREWVDWYNNRRLLEPIGNMPPGEAEARYHARIEAPALAA